MRSRWTKEEDRLLLEIYEQCPNQWRQICTVGEERDKLGVDYGKRYHGGRRSETLLLYLARLAMNGYYAPVEIVHCTVGRIVFHPVNFRSLKHLPVCLFDISLIWGRF